VLRRCGRCRDYKDVAEFAWRRIARGQLDNYCRPCRAAYKQEHYAANRERYIDQAMQRKRNLALERATFLMEFFRTHPCVDCRETDPIVLEFDHRTDKAFGIARGLRDRSWRALAEEMAKCDVVCANCHRRRTAHRGGWARAGVAQWQSLRLPI
jgi:hypothetical protein